MKYDIRNNDSVKIRPNLTAQDKQRISRFARAVSGADMDYYVPQLLRQRGTFKVVVGVRKTAKKPTEYATIYTPEHIQVPIQARYLIVSERKAAHPLTKIFL